MNNETIVPSFQPYMLRAAYDWCCTFGTPFILVYGPSVTDPTLVPFIRGGGESSVLVLNIGPQAVRSLDFGEDHLSFTARVGGKEVKVFVEYCFILRLQDRDTGAGVEITPLPMAIFAHRDQRPAVPEPGKRPSLKVVK